MADDYDEEEALKVAPRTETARFSTETPLGYYLMTSPGIGKLWCGDDFLHLLRKYEETCE